MDIEESEAIYCESNEENDRKEAFVRRIKFEDSTNHTTQFFKGKDTSIKEIAKNVKRACESPPIVKLEQKSSAKKKKISDKVTENAKSNDENVTILTLTDDNLRQLFEKIIDTASEAIHDKDKSEAQNKSTNTYNYKQKATSSESQKRPGFITQPGKRTSTRGTRSSTEKALINPIKYFDCELCKAGFYTSKSLHEHYVKKHPSTNVKNGTFGVDVNEQQESSTKCHICGYIANSSDELRIHKSYHVRPEFCAYKCNYCELKFCLETELKSHKKLCKLSCSNCFV